MPKIIVFGVNFNDDQQARLEKVGPVKYASSPNSVDEFVQQSQGFDIICSDGSCLYDSLPHLKNVFVTYPYIELGPFNSEDLKKNGVYVANTQGSSRETIAEWALFMVLALFRQFIPLVRTTTQPEFQLHESLVKKKILIVGKGNIGTRVGELLEAFDAKVDYFSRGEDLIVKASDADMVINSLNCNSSTYKLLDEKFFKSLKIGAYFVSYVRHYTYDLDGLMKAIDEGIVAGAAIDCDPEEVFDTSNAFYQKALTNHKILATPHVAFSSKFASANGREFALQNIEAYAAGQPKRILTKI
jgi:phosphoglycerate dehydrogenase-like enzyme